MPWTGHVCPKGAKFGFIARMGEKGRESGA